MTGLSALGRMRGAARRLRRHDDCRGSLDFPGDGVELPAGRLIVTGWAVNGQMSATHVEVETHGRSWVATVGVARPDVAMALKDPAVPAQCGWEAEIDISGFAGRTCVLRASSIHRDGRRTLLGQHTIRVISSTHRDPGGPTGFTGALDAPIDHAHETGDLLIVSGWALFGNRAAARVEVFVDGQPAGRARLHVARPDVGDRLAAADATVCGFESRLDITMLRGATRLVVEVHVHSLDGEDWRSGPRVVWLDDQQDGAGRAGDSGEDPRERAAELTARTRLVLDRCSTDRQPGTHVLVLTHSLALGGGQLYLSEVLKRLLEIPDLRVTVVAPTDGALRVPLEALGIDVHVTAASAATAVDAYEGRVRELALFAKTAGCDVALVNTLGIAVGADAAQRAGLPVLWAIHESFALPDFHALNFGVGGLEPAVQEAWLRALRRASALIFEADATRDMFAAYADAARRLTVPYGIDTAQIAERRRTCDRASARSSLGLADESVVLLCMGVFEERKAQASLVAAFREIADVNPHAVLALVGDHPGVYSDAIAEQVHRSGLRERVLLIPITPDIEPWYAAANVMLCPSDIESLPRSVLEAMAFGLPVVTSDVFGLPELITDGVTGWLHPARDLGALVAALARVLSFSQERLNQVAAAGEAHVREHYDSAGYGRDFAALLRGLAASPDADPLSLLEGRTDGLSARAADGRVAGADVDHA